MPSTGRRACRRRRPSVDGTLRTCMAVSATRGRGRDRAICRAASDEVRRCSKRLREKTKKCFVCRRNTEGLFSAPALFGLPHSSAHGHHGATDVARSVPEPAPRAFRRVQGRPHRPVRGEGGNSQALRRASPRSPTAVLSPHGTSIAVAYAPRPVRPASRRSPSTSAPRTRWRRSRRASRRRASSACTSCRRWATSAATTRCE